MATAELKGPTVAHDLLTATVRGYLWGARIGLALVPILTEWS